MTEASSGGSSATSDTRPSSTSSKSSKKKKRPKRGQCSFTADSPYFTAYVDKEMKSLSTLSETLRDISARAKTFGKCGKLMSEATRRLSQSCKLQPHNEELGSLEELEWSEKEQRRMRERRKSVGDEMGQVLTVLGEVLDEVADAQIQMCESLEASLSLSLEAFAEAEVRDANSLKTEAEELTEEGESAFAKYLHGKGAGGNSAQSSKDGTNISGGASEDAVMQTWNKISEGVGNQLGRMGITASGNGTDGNGGDSGNISPVRTKRGKSNGSEKKEQVDKAIESANTRFLLEEIRLAQANSELKRCHLLKRLDSIKSRRDIELGESALASLNGIKAFFHHCSDLIEGLTPRLQSIQNQQIKTRQTHKDQQPTMERREQGLRQVINEVKISAANAGVIADAITRGQTTGMGASIITDQPNSLEAIEEETKIWSLSDLLTEHALYIRDQKPGIEVEGWLYKKASTRMAMSTWSKRWFILDKTGIYYLKGGSLSENGKFGSSNGSLERVKVCDIVLCTVRIVVEKGKGNTAIRFCFEIISPNNRPYMLQALGPKELSTWVGSIRQCLERQLTHGNLPSDNLLLKPGTPKVLRSSKGGFPPGSTNEGDVNSSNMESPGVSSMQSPPPKNPIVRGIIEENLLCADCGMKRPEWVSLNLGLVMCIECSGVHRSLGVHLSKVRSLRLDQLSQAEYRVIKSLGNEFCNSIWEGDVSKQKGWKKPKPTDDRKVKEEWIKSKYQWRGFINLKELDGLSEEEGLEKLQLLLYENAKKGDVRGTARAIALGAEVNWQNDEDGGKTPLHACTTGSKEDYPGWKGIETAELLIQNGAKINATCLEDKTVLDTALLENADKELMEYLIARLG